MNLKRLLHLVNFNYLKPNHLATLIIFNDNPTEFFTYNTLLHNLSIPKRTLERVLEDLVNLDLIIVHRGHKGGAHPTPTRFIFNVQENNSPQPE